MKKVLIITYYWPPSGGAGVQRWVKLSKYLMLNNIEPIILTVDEHKASYMQLDNSLLADIHPDIKVFKTNSFEPINFYSKLVGKKNVPTAGFSNVNNQSKKQKFVNAVRSRLFIPDPRKGWVKYAYKEAKRLISTYNIDTVITSSPPHSSQIIGLKLKKNLDNKWIADLRDPWTDIYYYNILGHSKRSKKIDAKYEKAVLNNADTIFTVSNELKQLFASKIKDNKADKIKILPNGYDPQDFEGIVKHKNTVFNINYTGTMSDIYQPEAFFDVLEKIKKSDNLDFHVKIIGMVSSKIKSYIQQLDISCSFIDTVPHSEINKYQVNADMLLLVIPEIPNNKGILTGKLFEYLASKNNICNIGPTDGDAAQIIENCKCGASFNRKETDKLYLYIKKSIENYRISPNIENIELFSREKQAKEIIEIIKN